MTAVRILILAALIVIFVQDITSRAVHGFIFPCLAALFFLLHLLDHEQQVDIWFPALINVLFLAVQFILVSLYFSVKSKRFVNITNGLLGWGDVLFLLSIALYLSALNFFIFYITSLAGCLLIWLVWQAFAKQKTTHIPLAGLQAILFFMFLIGDWYFIPVNITSDDWVLRIVNK